MVTAECHRAAVPRFSIAEYHWSYPPQKIGTDLTCFKSSQIEPRGCRVLVVDDDPNIIHLVGRMIKRIGYAPTLSMGPMDALSQLRQADFDILLTDYDMPEMNGYDLAKKVKAKLIYIKVVIMTGHCPETISDIIENNSIVDAFLLKPFSLNDLKNKIIQD